MYPIHPLYAAYERAALCNAILRALPDWFGIEESIVDYVDQVQSVPFWAAHDGDKPVGFAALKAHTPFAAEVMVMGVLESHHRLGIGKGLIGACEGHCIDQGYRFLTVKTLADTHPDPGYARTRHFYRAMGFLPLEVFPTLWDEANPCLLMVKPVGAGA